MLRTLNRWQHKLFAEYFHLPEGTEPLQNRPLPNRPLPAAHANNHHAHANDHHAHANNHHAHANDHHAHANDHEPRLLKAWQKSIGNFVERHTAQKEV
jgi:hypothetical protein